MVRNYYLDLLKLVMAIMVVFIHAHFLQDISNFAYFITSQGLFRIAVPVFFIINGFYFYHAVNKGRHKDWFKRVIQLYLFWMLFYAYFWLRPDEFTYIEIFRKIIMGYFHLWYIPAVICSAVMMLFFKRKSNKFNVFISFILYSTGAIIQYAGNFDLFGSDVLNSILNTTWIYRNFIFFGFPFFCAGYIISKFDDYRLFSFRLLIPIAFFSTCLLILESYFNYLYHNDSIDMHFSLLISSLLIFLVFLKAGKKTFISSGLNSRHIAGISSGIYFTHPFILSVLKKITDLDYSMLAITAVLL